MKPGEEIRLVKENLAFAVAFWKGAASGKIPAGSLVRPDSEVPLFNQQAGRPPRTQGELKAELSRGAANQMRAAFALSALQVQRSLEATFPGEPIHEEWPELRAARSAMHLIGRAVENSILQPVWECPPAYRRLFHIRRFGFTLNATALEGRVLSWDDFGGLERYLKLLEYLASSAAAAGSGNDSRTLPNYAGTSGTRFGGVIGGPGTVTTSGDASPLVSPPRGYRDDATERRLAPDAPPLLPPLSNGVPDETPDEWETALAEQAGQWHSPDPEDEPETREDARRTPGPRPERSLAAAVSGSSVSRFVSDNCETGDGCRMLAGELYAGFQRWCRESGHQPVSQRAFGIRLTALGLHRKRRGHGKHWWMGVRLADAPSLTGE